MILFLFCSQRALILPFFRFFLFLIAIKLPYRYYFYLLYYFSSISPRISSLLLLKLPSSLLDCQNAIFMPFTDCYQKFYVIKPSIQNIFFPFFHLCKTKYNLNILISCIIELIIEFIKLFNHLIGLSGNLSDSFFETTLFLSGYHFRNKYNPF